MKIYLQEDPLSLDDKAFLGHASTPKEAFDKIAEHFDRKLQAEREQMGIDAEALKALKTLKNYLK